MATAQEFKSMGISMFPSQDREIILGKQSVLSEYGAGVREAVRKLPPEVSKALLAGIESPPKPTWCGKLFIYALAR